MGYQVGGSESVQGSGEEWGEIQVEENVLVEALSEGPVYVSSDEKCRRLSLCSWVSIRDC